MRMLIAGASGLILGDLCWAAGIILQGDSLPLALQGQVENGIDLLIGMSTLGLMVGSVVGTLWAIGWLLSPRPKQNQPA